MQKVAKFHKVSFSQFQKDWANAFGETPSSLYSIFNNIKLPLRGTQGSAGYDFFAPTTLIIPPKTEILVPTGIRAELQNGTFLAVFPRSGLGFKFRLQLNNTVGIIDADYFNAENEGHIMLKLYNDTIEEKTVEISAGSGFTQGIFLPFGITTDDQAIEKRTGGFGSTG